MDAIWKAIAAGGPFAQAFSALLSLFALATVHLAALFSIIPPSIRRLIDLESIGNATIHLYGSLAVATFLGLICTPILTLIFAFLSTRVLIFRGGTCIKVFEDVFRPVSFLSIQVLVRASFSFIFFLVIYLGLLRGTVMIFVSLVILALSIIGGLGLFILKSDRLPEQITNEYAHLALAKSFPVILAMFALSASWITGVYRSYHLIETSEVSNIRFDFRDRLTRVIFTTTSAGIITHTSSGFEFPLVVGIGKDHIDSFEFFPFNRIHQIDSVTKR